MPSYKILDAGDRVLFSGSDKAEVEAALARFLKRGAPLLSPVARVGGSWVGACGQPTKPHGADQTTTLNLSDFKLPPKEVVAAPLPVDDDRGCKIEELGLKRLVIGPTFEQMQLKVQDLVAQGAEMVGEIEDMDGEWHALLDTGATRLK